MPDTFGVTAHYAAYIHKEKELNMEEREPQKHWRGVIVRIKDDLGPHMTHFAKSCEAVILGSYSDQYYDHGVYDSNDTYTVLMLDKDRKPKYTVSWYDDENFECVTESNRDVGEQIWQDWKLSQRNDLEEVEI